MMKSFKSEFFKGYKNSKIKLTKKEQLEKAFKDILQSHLEEENYNEFIESTWAIPECAIDGITQELIKEVTIRTNLK